MPLPPVRAVGAVLAGLVALGAALAVARGRGRTLALALAAVAAAPAAVTLVCAALSLTAPVAELALLLPIALIGGLFDRSRAYQRMLAIITPPLLRATARRGAGARSDLEPVGPALAELLDARGLLLLAATPGDRVARVISGWHLAATDLRPGALDLDRVPFRDGTGVPRVADASGLLAGAAPSTLLPLPAAGRVEGYLLVVHGGGSTQLENAAGATLALCELLGAELAAARIRRERSAARSLVAAAAALDEETGAIADATARAHTGLALLLPTGATQWKNRRFDEALAPVAPRASGDLGRVVALFRRIGEAPLETLDRLLAGDCARVVAAELRIIASVTRAGRALLVEIDALDAATVAALAPSSTSGEVRVSSEPLDSEVYAEPAPA